MSVSTRIAQRYLWAARKRAHTAFLSAISILGLAVGVATLLISIALLTGLQGQITSRLISSAGTGYWRACKNERKESHRVRCW